MNRKISTLEKLKTAEAVYVLLSRITNLPYVECDPETYDDQIFLFYSEENARKGADRFLKEKAPLQIIKVEKKSFLMFYTSLYPMGVNCIVVDDGAPMRIAIQLEELVRRVSPDQLPKGQILVENPQFHLTAIYYIQKVRNNQAGRWKKEAEELHEEMLAHYREGYYISAKSENGSMPLLRKKDGLVLQPLFTDLQEFAKFQRANKGMKLQNFIVSEKNFLKFLVKEASGIVINPFGISLVLQVKRGA